MSIKNYSKFLQNDSGATAIEYCLIAGGIAVMISVAVFVFGEEVKELFDYALSRLRNE